MTKGELRSIIKGILKEELSREGILKEELEGPSYVIRAWASPDQKKGTPAFDSSKKGIKYPEFDDVLKALTSSELSDLGAYEITWVKSGSKVD